MKYLTLILNHVRLKSKRSLLSILHEFKAPVITWLFTRIRKDLSSIINQVVTSRMMNEEAGKIKVIIQALTVISE